jgi:hypothetical protein
MMSSFLRAAAAAVLALALITSFSLTSRAQTMGVPEHFTATGFDVNSGRSVGVQIAVDRWSTDAERDRLLAALYEKGPGKLLETLQSLPKVGSIQSFNSLGWELRYARHVPLPDGGEQVTIVTDRPISFWETANQTRSLDYPFTVIELKMGADGEGEGKMSVATKISFDKNSETIVLENLAMQPVMLGNVKREKIS